MKKWVGLLLLLSALAIAPAQAQIEPISGFDPRSMEIDGNVVYDATCKICVFPGNTADCFTRSPCTDWSVRQSDGLAFLLDPIGNQDTSILSPDSILSDGSTLPKQDIYRIGLANDLEYFWLSEERRSNNGTSAWHVFMTRTEPTAVQGQRVVFHFLPGDLEVRICFPRGGAVEDAAIVTKRAPAGTPPTDVIADDIWSSNVLSEVVPVAGFMMNATTITALAGALDSHGDPVAIYEPATFAEAAIRLSDVGISPCDTRLYITVITRSSCTLTSDLKDIAGPVEYNFGGPTLVVDQPGIGCNTSVHFKATASGGNKPYTFQWYDRLNGAVAETLFRTSSAIDLEPAVDEFDFTLSAGTHDVRVVVTDDSSCSDDVDVPQFTVYNALGLTCSAPTPDCSNKSTLSATASGGTGSYKYEWCDNGSPIGGNTSSFDYTFPNPTVPTDHTIRVLVTDVGRSDVVCTIDCSRTVTVYKILGGSLATGTQRCGGFDFTATATGGKAPFDYAWTLDGSPVGGNSATYRYAADADCTDHEVCVTITDDRGCTFNVCKKVHQVVTTTFP